MSIKDEVFLEQERRLGKKLANTNPKDLQSNLSTAGSSENSPNNKKSVKDEILPTRQGERGIQSESLLTIPAQKYSHPSQREIRKDITMSEVAKHRTKDSLWICVSGKCYDITKY